MFFDNNIVVKLNLHNAKNLYLYRHNDWPYAMRYLFNNSIYDKNLKSNFENYMQPSHTDIDRLRLGGVGGQVS